MSYQVNGSAIEHDDGGNLRLGDTFYIPSDVTEREGVDRTCILYRDKLVHRIETPLTNSAWRDNDLTAVITT